MRVKPNQKLDPYGFARYQGMQSERDAVLAHLSRCAATVKGGPQGEVLYDEYFELIDDIVEERHHHL